MEETVATAAPQARSIGERLRAGRERAGLSIAAAAEKLHLDAKVIESLEADRFAELGPSVYVRGHLRRYGDFVGEPGLALVDIYDKSRTARAPAPDLTRIPQTERRADPRRLPVPLIALGTAAVLALGIWWIFSGSRDDAGAKVAQAEVSANEPSPVPDASVLAGLPSAQDPSPTPPAAVVAPAPAAPTAEAPKPEAPARATRLRLQLASESWIEIYDSRGERLFYDIASAGSVQSVEGRPPLRVVLGSSVGVAVEVDGQRREIPASAIDGEGARFVVNRSGSLSRSRQ